MRRRATNPRGSPIPALILLAGLLTATHPPDAVGQTRYVGAMNSGDDVEVRLDRGEVLRGRFVRLHRTGLVLEVGDRERILAADDIDRVWWYHDRTRDFAVGGAVGAGVTTGVTLSLLSGGSWSYLVGTALPGAAVGVVFGTLAGTVAGSMASGWEEVDIAFLTGAADVPLGVDLAVAPTARQTEPVVSLGLRVSVPAPR